jgi:hypothetical protein
MRYEGPNVPSSRLEAIPPYIIVPSRNAIVRTPVTHHGPSFVFLFKRKPVLYGFNLSLPQFSNKYQDKVPFEKLL